MKTVCLSTSEIEKRLRDAGVNPTAQRIAICRYILCETEHPTAEEIKAWADKNFPKMSLATVYNTLGVLVQAGLLKELKFPHSDKVIYDDRMVEHYHFLDEETGELIDIPADQVEIVPKFKRNLKVRSMDLLLRGTSR